MLQFCFLCVELLKINRVFVIIYPQVCCLSGDDMELQRRKPNRLNGFDYSVNGYYFITMCTANKQKIFGSIVAQSVGDCITYPQSVGACIARPQTQSVGDCITCPQTVGACIARPETQSVGNCITCPQSVGACIARPQTQSAGACITHPQSVGDCITYPQSVGRALRARKHNP